MSRKFIFFQLDEVNLSDEELERLAQEKFRNGNVYRFHLGDDVKSAGYQWLDNDHLELTLSFRLDEGLAKKLRKHTEVVGVRSSVTVVAQEGWVIELALDEDENISFDDLGLPNFILQNEEVVFKKAYLANSIAAVVTNDENLLQGKYIYLADDLGDPAQSQF